MLSCGLSCSRRRNNKTGFKRSRSTGSGKTSFQAKSFPVQNIWKNLTRIFWCPFIGSYVLDTWLVAYQPYKQLVEVRSSEWVVSYESTDSCCFTQTSKGFREGIVSNWYLGVPASISQIPSRLQREGMCRRTETPVFFWRDSSLVWWCTIFSWILCPFKPPGQIVDKSSVYLRYGFSPGRQWAQSDKVGFATAGVLGHF